MVIYSKTFLDDDLIEKLNFYILFLVGGSWEQFKSANCRFQIEFDEYTYYQAQVHMPWSTPSCHISLPIWI